MPTLFPQIVLTLRPRASLQMARGRRVNTPSMWPGTVCLPPSGPEPSMLLRPTHSRSKPLFHHDPARRLHPRLTLTFNQHRPRGILPTAGSMRYESEALRLILGMIVPFFLTRFVSRHMGDKPTLPRAFLTLEIAYPPEISIKSTLASRNTAPPHPQGSNRGSSSSLQHTAGRSPTAGGQFFTNSLLRADRRAVSHGRARSRSYAIRHQLRRQRRDNNTTTRNCRSTGREANA